MKYADKKRVALLEFNSVQLLSHVRLLATTWTASRQASLSITNSQSLPKLKSIESVMPSNHLILCHPLLLLLSIFPNIRVFSKSQFFALGGQSIGVQLQHQSFQWIFPSLSFPSLSFPSLVAQLVKNLCAMQDTWVPSLDWEDPLEKGKATHSSILAWVTKSQTQLSDFHLLEYQNSNEVSNILGEYLNNFVLIVKFGLFF